MVYRCKNASKPPLLVKALTPFFTKNIYIFCKICQHFSRESVKHRIKGEKPERVGLPDFPCFLNCSRSKSLHLVAVMLWYH